MGEVINRNRGHDSRQAWRCAVGWGAKMDLSSRYPKPGAVGGKLIRQVVRFFRDQKIAIPIKTSHILIASSGGPDSTALAHLLIKYGRRVVATDRIELLHVNHGWRGAESDQDEAFVLEFARRMGVKSTAIRVDSPHQEGTSADRSPYARSRSWEEVARTLRKDVFTRWARERGAWILTAHQKDDLAETVLWRLLTGAAQTQGGGIALRHGVELRPLLDIRKKELLSYLEEEAQSWRSDSTNDEDRFLRARMRKRLFPELEAIFPKAVENLARLGLDAQARDANDFAPERLIGSARRTRKRIQ
jgi:tRNA(Ile)-lysidine synthase